MLHAMLSTFAIAALLSTAPAAAQTYNPYVTVDTPASKKGKGSTYLRMGQPPGGTSTSAKKKKPEPVFDYEDDDLPAGNKEKRKPKLRSR
jgi:hypothetical protein